jgi:hypothetical protein
MTSKAQNSAYLHNGVQYGGARMTTKKIKDGLVSGHNFAKDNKIISKFRGATDALGGTSYLDRKTGGLYTKGTDYAISNGYGKRKKKKTKK